MEFKSTIIGILIGITALSALPSCMKQQVELTYSAQDEAIDKYARSVLDTAKEGSITYNSGACRLTTRQGKGESLSPEGTISFYYAGYVFDRGFSPRALFCTNHEMTAAEAGWQMETGQLTALTINLKDTDLIEGLKKGLEGVKAGEECQILFSGKYGFGRKPFGIIPANSALLYKIWVKSISNE